jgi:eukaryotic-like serine/threonine-protein kinase
MTPERWQQISAIFVEAVSLDPAARTAYLDRVCSGDPELRAEVESLIASSPPDGDHFLDTPVLCLQSESAPAARDMAGTRVGPYELFEEIGRGGMGAVYRARRADGQFEQEVAVKLVRAGYEDRRTVLQRFWTERQILATLDHPNIARLFDGGATAEGSPYLVMELIEGANICEYCDARRLDTAARLSLFRQVCSAVQYAHQRLIVHRDIKPSNILVTADGVPKLLDFGIAKILAPASDAEATQHRPMTLAFASPEQIRGDPMTTVSDVYSLGVVLYTLLSGRSPYRLDTRTPGGLYRAIEDEEPLRPSTAVGRPTTGRGDGADAALSAEAVSATREGSIARLTKRLSGDLDDIVLKALRKEPERRYASVEQFSADIERHLRGFPVSARHGTWTYRAQKFVRRHKAGMAAAVTITLVTVAGVAATLVEARLAAANGRRAEQRFEQVRKLANAMVFDVHDAIERLPGATKPRALIVKLGLEYLDQLSRDATADASLQLQVAEGYLKLGRAQGESNESNLGDQPGAAASYRKAIEILDRLYARDPQNREVITRLSEALFRLTLIIDSSSERRAMQTRALALRQADAAAHPDDLQAQRTLASGYFETGLTFNEDHRYTEAVGPFRQALAIFQEIDRRAPTDDSARNVALCDKRLAALSMRAGDVTTALLGYEAARAIDERRFAKNPDDLFARSDLTYDLTDLGTALRLLQRWDEAGDAYDRAIALRRAAYDQDKNDARARRGLASVLFRKGSLLHYQIKKPRQAIAPLREASQLWSLDGDHADMQRGEVEYELAIVYAGFGNAADAALHRAAALSIFSVGAKAGSLDANQQRFLAELRGASKSAVVTAARAVR